MSRRLIFAALLLAPVSGCVGCLDLFKLHLPDGGVFEFPDAGLGADGGFGAFLFDGFMPDPGPLFDGGTVKYGGIDVTTSFDGGVVRIVSISAGGSALETYTYWNGDDSYVTGTGDLNQDGQVDWEYESISDGGPVVTTIRTDTNFDGIFDTQDVWQVDTSQGLPFTKTETFSAFQQPDGGLATSADGGSWVQLWTYTGPGEANQAGGGTDCDGLAGFPIVGTGLAKLVPVPKTQIQIVDDPSFPGGCTDSQAQDLLAAFEAALEDIPLCMQNIRPELAGQVEAAAQSQPMFVGCGNTCSDTGATTTLPCKPGVPDTLTCTANQVLVGGLEMNVNPAVVWAQNTLQWREEIILHELLHFAGQEHSPPPAGDPQGHDLVYGCGRFCVQGGLQAAIGGSIGGCQLISGAATAGWSTATPTAAQFAYDCADCANDANRKGCGVTYDIYDCATGDCGFGDTGNNQSCPAGTICCAWTALNCWGNQATGLGNRNSDLYPVAEANCNQTQCGSEVPAPNCDVGNPVDLPGTGQANCTAFPVSWCRN